MELCLEVRGDVDVSADEMIGMFGGVGYSLKRIGAKGNVNTKVGRGNVEGGMEREEGER